MSLHLSKEDWSRVWRREAKASRQAGHWVRVTVTQVSAVPDPSLGVVDFKGQAKAYFLKDDCMKFKQL